MLKQTKQNFLKDIEIIKKNFSKTNSSNSSKIFQNENSLSILKPSDNTINNCDIPTVI